MLPSCYVGSRDLLFHWLCSAGSTIFAVLSLVGLACGPASNSADERSGQSESTRELTWPQVALAVEARAGATLPASAFFSQVLRLPRKEIEKSKDMEPGRFVGTCASCVTAVVYLIRASPSRNRL